MSYHSPVHILSPMHHHGYYHHSRPYMLPSHYSSTVPQNGFPARLQLQQNQDIEMQNLSPHSADEYRLSHSHEGSEETHLQRRASFDGVLPPHEHETVSAGVVEERQPTLADTNMTRSRSFDGVLHMGSTDKSPSMQGDIELQDMARSQAGTVITHEERAHLSAEEQHEMGLPSLNPGTQEEHAISQNHVSPKRAASPVAEVRLNISENPQEWEDIPLDEQRSPQQMQPQSSALVSQPQMQHPPHIAIDIAEAEPQQPARQQEIAARQEEAPVSCFDSFKRGLARFFNSFNPFSKEAREARRLEAQRKEERRQRAAEAAQQRAAHEQTLTNYFGAMGTLVSKVLGRNANLTVKPETVQREEDERLLSWRDVDHNRLPVYKREADITADGREYHVAMTEVRKADPKNPTKFPYMYPTNDPPHYCRQDKKEQTPDDSYEPGRLLTFQLDGPEQEKLSYDLHPRPSILSASIEYTEPGGQNTHKRGYSKFKNSLASSDIRSGDRRATVLTEGVRAALNRAEVKPLLALRAESAEAQERLKTLLDESATYVPPQIGDGHRKPTKVQKQALMAYEEAFSKRRRRVENLVSQALIANADLKKIQATRRRSEELPKAQMVLNNQLDALVSALEAPAPRFEMPEEAASSCWPSRQ